MFDGKNWYSDFKQIDMFGGKGYRNRETFDVYFIKFIFKYYSEFLLSG